MKGDLKILGFEDLTVRDMRLLTALYLLGKVLVEMDFDGEIMVVVRK